MNIEQKPTIERRKNKLAVITLYLDIIDDFYRQEKFPDEIQWRVENALKANEKLLKLTYGKQPLEKFDEYKEQIIKESMKVIKGEFKLIDE